MVQITPVNGILVPMADQLIRHPDLVIIVIEGGGGRAEEVQNKGA